MVETKVIKLTEHNELESVRKAAETIKNGGLVVYPTETSYGIAADATNEEAVKEVFKVKNRPFSKPIPIIIDSIERMEKYGVLNERSMSIARKFMPGPLTLIIDKKGLPDVLNPKEIAFRVSSHPIAFKLSKVAECPITSTSANLSGELPLYRVDDVKAVFRGKVNVILDYGNLPKIKPSTIADLRAETIKIVREGPISEEEIKRNLSG